MTGLLLPCEFTNGLSMTSLFQTSYFLLACIPNQLSLETHGGCHRVLGGRRDLQSSEISIQLI